MQSIAVVYYIIMRRVKVRVCTQYAIQCMFVGLYVWDSCVIESCGVSFLRFEVEYS